MKHLTTTRPMRCAYCYARLREVDILTAREQGQRVEVHVQCWRCQEICSVALSTHRDSAWYGAMHRDEDIESVDGDLAPD